MERNDKAEDLGQQRRSKSALKEQIAKTTLRCVRSQGHQYVDLREDGRRFVFFCTLCLAPCYSASILHDHLNGNLHAKRLVAAKLTLLRPNPWPFNDGVHFFDVPSDDENFESNSRSSDRIDEEIEYLLIPNVSIFDEISVLKARFVGLGKIAARVRKKDDGSDYMSSIWCEWLGQSRSGLEPDDSNQISDHDFAVITFVHDYRLGRAGLFDEWLEPQVIAHPPRLPHSRRSSEDEPSPSHGHASSSKLPLVGNDEQLLQTQIITNRTVRRAVRRQQRIASERMCDICQQKMLQGKDVSTLMNRKTGRLTCNSRNLNGVFHLFHTSCLIHWILICESEIVRNQPINPKTTPNLCESSRSKCKKRGIRGKNRVLNTQIDQVFCPQCHGTGLNLTGNHIETGKINLSEIFKYKIWVSDGWKAWMDHPELLQNCSIGFQFPSPDGEITEGKVISLKLLPIYRADV